MANQASTVRQRARRIWLFERRSFTDSALLDQWRSTWPRWRRLVRPVGASALWLALLVEVFASDEGAFARPAELALAAIVLTCVAIGVIDYLKAGGEVALQHSDLDERAAVPAWSRWIPRAGAAALQRAGLAYLAVIVIVLLAFVVNVLSILVYGLLAIFVIAVLLSPSRTGRVITAIGAFVRSNRGSN